MARKAFYTHKRNFTAGEVGEILHEKVDFVRYLNGCHQLENMIVFPQGPVSRRSGFKFVYDLTLLLGSSIPTVKPRMIPFVFSEAQRYVLVFFKHSSGTTRVAFLTNEGLVESATPGVPYVFEFTTPVDIEEFDYAQSADVIYIAQPTEAPIEFSRLAHNSWSAAAVSFVGAPTGLSGWSAPDNWPTKVGFFEQRIVYAATKVRPQTLWFSASADFTEFTVPATLLADSPVTLTPNSAQQNRIKWLFTARALIVGTIGDEWTVGGKGLEPLSFSSFSMVRHTNQGSKAIKPLMIGPVTVFVEELGRVVNQFTYNYATDSYDVVDLSILAPHLTELNSIVDWSYQKTPHGVIWAVRNDGIFMSLTMKREHNVIGWHRHTTDGEFMAVSCIPGDIETDVFTAVERVIDGDTKWYLEVKEPQFSSDISDDGRFLDSHLVYQGVAVDTISGLDHLEGKEVHILVEGQVHPPRTVSSGEIELVGDFDYVVVGLPYASRVIPTPSVVPHKDGTSQGRIHRVFETYVSLYKSSGMKVGIQDMGGNETLTYVPIREAEDLTEESTPLFTGYIVAPLPEGSAEQQADRITRVIIEQDDPLPLTVLGLVDRIYTSE